MKATGVVRRIDELGRIVIPKEIRKTLRIHEGENLEIYVDGQNSIILKKYSLINKIEDFAQNLTDSVYMIMKKNILITDMDNVIAVSGPMKKEYLGKVVSNTVANMIQKRESIVEKSKTLLSFIEDKTLEGSYVFDVIISNGDVVGSVILVSETENLSEEDKKIANIISNFLAKHLEE